MNVAEPEPLNTYKLVVNHEEQNSIWPVERELPLGWSDAAKKSDTKAECKAFIKEVCPDMRPLSLTRLMEERDSPGSSGQTTSS